ncbi:MAG: aspartyl-phosphate phosphatase Spo0E family protein [Desulfosporosinus sp.]|nr:aspartyl-phosphate phosphatase Spo0E family protein [Desulfosporosinus sp.]
MEIDILLNEIALYRCQMNRFTQGKSRTDPDVIKLSQGLDSLIHEYFDFRKTLEKSSHYKV